jgi:hypothetical protein
MCYLVSANADYVSKTDDIYSDQYENEDESKYTLIPNVFISMNFAVEEVSAFYRRTSETLTSLMYTPDEIRFVSSLRVEHGRTEFTVSTRCPINRIMR